MNSQTEDYLSPEANLVEKKKYLVPMIVFTFINVVLFLGSVGVCFFS
jgi:hypothetical protein